MLGLHKKEGYHCFVVYVKKGKKNSIDTYSTPGFATQFLENDIDGIKYGAMMEEAFQTAFKGILYNFFIYNFLLYILSIYLLYLPLFL